MFHLRRAPKFRIDEFQVLVHGFKSYKDQARLEELSPQVNVVGACSCFPSG